MEPKPPQPGEIKETPKGRRLCAWCKKDRGPSGIEGDTHFICKECWLENFPNTPWVEPTD